MAARAIWQATLEIGRESLPVKLYSAVEDRQIHFHMLHKRDRTRVHQEMVDSRTGRKVPAEEMIKAFEVERGRYVKVTDEEIERSEPAPAREVRVSRFVPVSAIDPFLFERPYYVGPDSRALDDYFALAAALEKKTKAGLAQWVMRKHAYRGALVSHQGYLMLVTLRAAREVIPVDQLNPPGGAALGAKEKDLAAQLLEQLAGTFRAADYHDEYQERVHELIDAKRKGKRIKPKRRPRRVASKSLEDSLEKSLRALRPARRG